MSQATASIPSIRPARRGIRDERPRLRALPRPSAATRPRVLYALVAVATVMGIVATQLLLSIGVSGDAYRLESLQTTNQRLNRDYQQVSETVQALSSPQNLAANAQALGMVDNSTPVYLSLATGQVIGTPTPASASAGTDGQAMVANALTQGIPLVTAPKTKTTTPKKATSGTASDSATSAGQQTAVASGPVPWTGALPAPSTH
jgi:hypothetical protein